MTPVNLRLKNVALVRPTRSYARPDKPRQHHLPLLSLSHQPYYHHNQLILKFFIKMTGYFFA
ncbi:hypothetical protein SARI_00186 [Salmonella enterica subsp. arizonae serovar 62:z4,z23:-]|uniref:Uncharacterized protein n=1 Tax=Salmonella arizonae (strain ATCC BAA-731 / CDC346-86 / RSK2980) TaxID=41514 RepID=A9MG25_SALAR|nr:hypothetical protein SARI_00186 [Salmonella enterica subsp. arizonae serovar 62:z4,z23:-]